MDRLWAPWRASYLNRAMEVTEHASCVFCELPASGQEQYREHGILSASKDAFVILNRYPYNVGHFMVIPRGHVSELSQLSSEEYVSVMELLRSSIDVLRDVMRPEGINIGMNLGRASGAGIPAHCHFHVVPRWNGDTNFMPIIGNTKVLSTSLTEVYDTLLPAFEKISNQMLRR